MLSKFLHNEYHEKFDMFKAYLIYILTSIAVVFSFGLALKGMHSSSEVLTTLLFATGIISLFNLIYLQKTHNYAVVGYVFVYTFYVLMFYLVYTGGVNGNTGPLWIYFLAPLTLYMQGLKKGLISIGGFILVLFVILYILEPSTSKAEYHDSYKLRILLSFLLSTFVSAAYEYSRSFSYAHVCALQEKIETISLHDDLTGVYNRRGYRKYTDDISSTQGIVLMCDIDKFKNINDTFGHMAGDDTLKEVAICIKKNLRSEDIVVRWGGDEFFIFLPNTNIENAQKIIEKIEKSIENLKVSYSKTLKLSVSIGLAILDSELSLDDTIREADNNMYNKKYDKILESRK